MHAVPTCRNLDPQAPEEPALAVLEDLEIGSYELEARKLGYRTYRRRAEIPELADYSTGPVVLERTAAQVEMTRGSTR